MVSNQARKKGVVVMNLMFKVMRKILCSIALINDDVSLILVSKVVTNSLFWANGARVLIGEEWRDRV